MSTLDLNQVRLDRALRALEDLERWAENQADPSLADPTPRRVYEDDGNRLVDVVEQDGAESAYADVATRLARLRTELTAPDEPPSDALRRFREVLDALHGELAWCDAKHAEALDAAGDAIEPAEIHAEGRARALSALRAELRALIDAAPRGTA